MYCEHCGARQPLGAVICEVCGGGSTADPAASLSGEAALPASSGPPRAAWVTPGPANPSGPSQQPARELPSRELALPIGAATAVGVGLFHFSELVYYGDTLGSTSFLGVLPGTLTVFVLAGGWAAIAGVLSVSLFRGSRLPSVPRWILPTLLLVELAVQAWWADTLQDLSVAVTLPLVAAACFLRVREADGRPGPSSAPPPASATTSSFAPTRPNVSPPPFVPTGGTVTSPPPAPIAATSATAPAPSGPPGQGQPVERANDGGPTAPTASPGIRLLSPGSSPGTVAAIIAVELGLPVEAVLQRIEQGPVVVFRGATRERLVDLRASLLLAGAALGTEDADE